MGKAEFRDFDAMLAEMEEETFSFQLFGQRYEMKKRLPAALVLKLARAEPDQRVEAQLMAQTARALLGQGQFDRLMGREEFTLELLGEILRWAFRVIEGGEESGGALTEDGPEETRPKN